MTYQQVTAWGRTPAGQAAQQRISDCYPDDPNLGLTDAQIQTAMVAMGYPPGSKSAGFAVAYYLASGQNLWPACGAQASNDTASGSLPTPNPQPLTAGLDSSTLWLIGGGVLLLLFLKRMADG